MQIGAPAKMSNKIFKGDEIVEVRSFTGLFRMYFIAAPCNVVFAFVLGDAADNSSSDRFMVTK
jgi:hypothetical protein